MSTNKQIEEAKLQVQEELAKLDQDSSFDDSLQDISPHKNLESSKEESKRTLSKNSTAHFKNPCSLQQNSLVSIENPSLLTPLGP